MKSQMIGAGETITQSVAVKKPKTHPGQTIYGYGLWLLDLLRIQNTH
jgi:hypothetical protein